MNIAIIGAGWYGCHLGKVLKDKGINVDIYEKENDIFQHASSKNQNRLHLGFHYPRSAITRNQSKKGYYQFLNTYGEFCKPIKNNMYAVDDEHSLVDYDTYTMIMNGTGLEFKETTNNKFNNLTGLIRNDEMVIDFKKAKMYFEKVLSDSIHLNTEIIDDDIINKKDSIIVKNKKYDYMINCTWATFRNNFGINTAYESCLVALYTTKKDMDFGLTIMDGEFVSLYPYNTERIYTLTSVKNTVLKRDKSYETIKNFTDNLTRTTIENNIIKMEKEISYYYPTFKNEFEFSEYFTIIKSKIDVKTESREVAVKQNNRELFVFSGKIDTIFEAENKILEIIG